MLTFIVKPNDQVTLKTKLIYGKWCHNKYTKMLFGGKTVTIVYTYRTNCHSYIHCIDKSGTEIELSVNSISRKYVLRRNHKRYNLYNKKLIV
jgi:hypothetical protein